MTKESQIVPMVNKIYDLGPLMECFTSYYYYSESGPGEIWSLNPLYFVICMINIAILWIWIYGKTSQHAFSFWHSSKYNLFNNSFILSFALNANKIMRIEILKCRFPKKLTQIFILFEDIAHMFFFNF